MAQTAHRAARAVTLTPVHLIRAGSGLDAVRVQARGSGWIFGSFGVLRVRGELDTVVFRRMNTCRALYLGTRGLRWVSVRLAPAGHLSIPPAADAAPPAPPALVPLPSLEVHLVVQPPECP